MLTTSNCCLCFGLRTGSLIIGWVQLVFPVLGIILGIIAKVKGDDNQSNDSAFTDTVSNNDGFWGDVVVEVFHVIMALCLLYGIYTNRKRFVYYYIFVEAVIIVLRIIIVVILLIMAAYSSVAVAIVSSLIVWAFLIYWLVVVYSFYLEMA